MASNSGLQSTVSNILQNNYSSVVTVAAVGYDYILTFSDEIEYIWSKPWTRVSTLFVLIRYSSLFAAVTASFFGTSFIPGPLKTYVFNLCLSLMVQPLTLTKQLIVILCEWVLFTFISAADLTMILRVWAIYGRSRVIFAILLMLYTLEIVPLFVACVTAGFKLKVGVHQVLDFTYCTADHDSPIWIELYDSLQITLAAVMCLFVIGKFIWDSFQMYKVTKLWKPSRYLYLFAREGMLYFFAMLLFALVDLLALQQEFSSFKGWTQLVSVQYVLVFTLTPRFILNVRALYARQIRGQCGSSDMDSHFGFTSVYGNSGCETTVVFAGLRQSEIDGLQQDEEIQMGDMRVRSANDGGVRRPLV